MKRFWITAALLAIAGSPPARAADSPGAVPALLTPSQVVAAAPAAEWRAIAAADLLVMELAADGKGRAPAGDYPVAAATVFARLDRQHPQTRRRALGGTG